MVPVPLIAEDAQVAGLRPKIDVTCSSPDCQTDGIDQPRV
jgi:hypothetical protein